MSGPVPELPAAYVERLQKSAPAKSPPVPASDNGNGKIPEGRRHEVLRALAGCAGRNGVSPEGIESIVRHVGESLCEPTPEFQKDLDHQARDMGRRWGSEGEASRLRAVKPDPSKFRPVDWLWEGKIPLGKFSMLVGQEGVGKGTLLAHLIARVTRGELPGELLGSPGMVLIFADEDDFSDTQGPRLTAAGADLEFVRHIEPAEVGMSVDISDDALKIRDLISEIGVKFVLLDPLDAVTPVSLDGWKSKPVRHALAPICAVAQETGAAVLGVRHLNKSNDSNPRNRISDSHAYNAISRSTLFVVGDNEDADSNRRFVVAVKRNLAKSSPVLEFEISSKTIQPGNLPLEVPVVSGLKASDREASDLLGKPKGGGPSKRAQAAQLLEDMLGDFKPHPAAQIKAALYEAGVSESTIERAKRDLEIQTSHDRSVPPVYFWAISSPFLRPSTSADEGLSPFFINDNNGSEGTKERSPFPMFRADDGPDPKGNPQ